ncbi:hypothetical protein EG329_014052 [Mollisiaceae sp. DMI_Dod_QoI]|nr:hypothetical protein EG329_014052 [Helotiales sp. DMI_Dod_QoI]
MAMLAFTAIAISAAAALFAYYVVRIVYRLYFHPLAGFPGSKLAAASLWYEFYYDVILRGKFMWKVQEMHKEYGSIIRINPDELHIDDPDYYDEIYGSTASKRDKYGPWVALAGTPGSSFSTVGHDHHKLRRGALNPFFSKKAVVALEPVVKAKVEILAKRFENAQMTGEVIRVDVAFMALTTDVVCQFAFANDDNMLMRDDFNLAWKETIIEAFEGGALLRQFPSMISMMNAVLDSMMSVMMPSMRLMLDWKAGVRRRVVPVLNRTESVSDIEKASHRTIFHELRDSNLSSSEKTVDRSCDEGQILTGAGSETTAKALTTAIFYLLEHKELVGKLKIELAGIAPDANTWTKFAQLPYLVTTAFKYFKNPKAHKSSQQ